MKSLCFIVKTSIFEDDTPRKLAAGQSLPCPGRHALVEHGNGDPHRKKMGSKPMESAGELGFDVKNNPPKISY